MPASRYSRGGFLSPPTGLSKILKQKQPHNQISENLFSYCHIDNDPSGGCGNYTMNPQKIQPKLICPAGLSLINDRPAGVNHPHNA